MTDRYPLIVDSTTGTIKELPSGDNLNLQNGKIVNVTSIAATNITVSTSATMSNLTINTIDVTPIHDITTIYVATAGNDTTGDGSASNPYATPHKAMDFLRPKRINVTEGYTRVTISVGVGTYNFGLNQTNAGTGYIDGTYFLSGGTGSGSAVSISTVGSATGAITQASLRDPGTGYLASDTLGINTTTGTGAVYGIFHVGKEGEILGPLDVDHVDGEQILITGGDCTGTKPGRRGNHFYNQVGVGVGSNPAGTGPNHTWSNVYDSSSPAGAYPNPMANGRGNTDASNIYNRGILEAYYTTKLYFQDTTAIVTKSPKCAKIDKLLLVGQNGDGSRRLTDDASILGVTNSNTVGISTDGEGTLIGRQTGGHFDLGDDISIHGFTYGIYMVGGNGKGFQTTITNTSGVGMIANRNCYVTLSQPTILNNVSHACYAYGGQYYAYGGSLSNNGTYGALNFYSGFAFLGNNRTDEVGFGNSTIIANNGNSGVFAQMNSVIRVDGRYNQELYVYGNSSKQLYAQKGGMVDRAGSNITVEAASGNATLASPAVNTIGNGGASITTNETVSF